MSRPGQEELSLSKEDVKKVNTVDDEVAVPLLFTLHKVLHLHVYR